MKKLIYASALGSLMIFSACGNNDDKDRIKSDSAAINAKPADSSFNSTNNQNANGGVQGTDSTGTYKKDSSISKDSLK